jgi:hypothetical protein
MGSMHPETLPTHLSTMWETLWRSLLACALCALQPRRRRFLCSGCSEVSRACPEGNPQQTEVPHSCQAPPWNNRCSLSWHTPKPSNRCALPHAAGLLGFWSFPALLNPKPAQKGWAVGSVSFIAILTMKETLSDNASFNTEQRAQCGRPFPSGNGVQLRCAAPRHAMPSQKEGKGAHELADEFKTNSEPAGELIWSLMSQATGPNRRSLAPHSNSLRCRCCARDAHARRGRGTHGRARMTSSQMRRGTRARTLVTKVCEREPPVGWVLSHALWVARLTPSCQMNLWRFQTMRQPEPLAQSAQD